MKNNSKLTLRDLLELLEARRTSEEQAAAYARLAADPKIAADLAWLERVIDLMRSDDSVDPPRAVVARVLRIFEGRAAPRRPSVIQRIVAALQFDSFHMPLAYGVRSGQPVARQLLYTADPFDVDVRITPDGDAWSVGGQVLGACDAGHALLDSIQATVEAPLNDLCEFKLPPVPGGRYALTIQIGTSAIEVETLDVGV